ncbi:hypothetical protein BBW65_03015 [Helicobacter enhydrae]|uniref:peptide chain release factor N(5)-glutamine methyltransferase n=1 Tax=Helicobacter enhydrae TaxID=222136 RepID=A0A1B1U571_9HELI|nr:HemK/PrmC family methyltransferase [Helicobacter enhydrae]ANV97835.1 hypothetical protein BBW65_03015 [Helicobacter enhydrae]
MPFSIKEALKWGADTLLSERPRLESEILLASVLQKDRVFLHTFDDQRLTPQEWERYQSFVLQAREGEPIEYLSGVVSFYDYEFCITKGVLIPRPETEILLEKVRVLVDQHRLKKVFELGVGSGVLCITLALLCPHLEVVGSDINPLAIKLTQQNIQKFSSLDSTLSSRITLIQRDVLQEECGLQDIDLIISNPPYIALDYPLDKKVLHEPREALFGGERGDEILLEIIAMRERCGVRFLACEMGYDQRARMQEALNGSTDLEFFRDLSGHDRGFVASF